MDWQKQLYKITRDKECYLAFIADKDTCEPLVKFDPCTPLEITKAEIQLIWRRLMKADFESFFNNGLLLGGEKYDCYKVNRQFLLAKYESTYLQIYATHKYIVAGACLNYKMPEGVQELSKELMEAHEM